MVNICVPDLVITDCCLFGVCFECAVISPDAFGEDIVWNETVTEYISVITLFFIGIWNLYLFATIRQRTDYKYLPVLRMNSAVYAIGTAFFGLSRIYYQVSRPVLTLAAIHNLCEWVFASFAFFGDARQRNLAMLASFVFIMVIIGLVNMLITDLPIYSATEQIPGLAIDILLPIVWWILYRQNAENDDKSNKTDDNVQYVYLTAFAAHFVHLFLTILPLVIVQLTRNQSEFLSRLMAFFVFPSVPWNHLMYTRFVTLYERHVDKVYEAESERDPQTLVNSPQCIKSRCNKLLFWYALCLVLSLFPNVIFPYLIGPCDVSVAAQSAQSEPSSFFMGTTEVIIEDGFNEAFEYQFKSKHLRSNALQFEGNVFYYIGKSNDNQNKYIFNEGWESVEAVRQWIASEHVQSVFGDYTQRMTVSTVLSSYQTVMDEIDTQQNDIGFGALSHTFKNWEGGCQAVWDHMKNISDCQWIALVDHCQVIDAENGVRRQYLKSNTEQFMTSVWLIKPYEYETVDPSDPEHTVKVYKYEYDVLEVGRRSTITLTYDEKKYGNDSCHFQDTFKTNISTDNIEESGKRFIALTIPYFDALIGVQNETVDSEECEEAMLCQDPSKTSL